MATIVNARDVALQATSPRVTPVQLPSNVSVGTSNLTDELAAKIGDIPSSGLTGSRTAVMEMYAWTDTPPALLPSGDSTLTWATGQFTAPANVVIDDADFDKVSLLLHFSGANNSTTFTDSSPIPKTITPNGDVKISTTQTLFSNSVAYFDGSGDYLHASNSPAFEITDGDFTIEAFVYPTSSSGLRAIVGYANGSSANSNFAYQLLLNDTQSQLNVFSGNTAYGSAAGTVPANAWTHIALVLSGTSLLSFVGGVLVNTASIGTASLNSPSGAVLHIGQIQGYYPYLGYLGELRITKGRARYTSAFTPPVAPFAQFAWSLVPGPDVSGRKLYMVRNPVGDDAASATTVETWDALTATEIKDTPVASTRTAVLELYMWAISVPTVFPSGTSTYTWSTGEFTSPSTPAGWSITPGASLPNGALYACRVLHDDTGSASTSVVTWPGSNTASVIAETSTRGARGNRRLYASDVDYDSGFVYEGNTAGAASFAAKATDLIVAATVGTIPNSPVNGDEVTFTNGTTYVYTISYNGSAWNPPGIVIDGSLLVTGSVTAAAIDALGLRVGTGGLIQATGYPGVSLDGSTPADAGADLAGARFGISDDGFAHVDTLLCWGQVFSYAIGSQNSGVAPVILGKNLGSGAGIKGQSATGFGGTFPGNATAGSLMVEPLGSLPSNKAAGSLCTVGGVLYFADGTNWRVVNLT